MKVKREDTSMLWFLQFVGAVCFVFSLFLIVSYMINVHDWADLWWYPWTVVAYFLAQALAWVAVAKQNFSRRQIYSFAWAPLVVAVGALVGSTAMFFVP